MKKVASGQTTVYIFSGTKVIAEYLNGTLSKEYIYAGSQLLATLEGATSNYHHSDHLSVRVTTDAAGTVIGQQGHYPFGESWYSVSNTTKWQFTSYERDAESGLDYAIFRYDSSRLGRFLTPDPLAGTIFNPQSLNRYAYVLNDPTNLRDPLGLYAIAFTTNCRRAPIWLELGPGAEICTVQLINAFALLLGFDTLCSQGPLAKQLRRQECDTPEGKERVARQVLESGIEETGLTGNVANLEVNARGRDAGAIVTFTSDPRDLIPSLGTFGFRLRSHRQNTPAGIGPELEVDKLNEFGAHTAELNFDERGTQGFGEKLKHIGRGAVGIENNPCEVREMLIEQNRFNLCKNPGRSPGSR